MNGLVLEGGAMRGMFTAGVLDVLMENGIRFDGAVGVSAGAVFGCNFKSGQIGRVIRYNKRFARDPRYCGIGSWILTGDLYNRKFCYDTVPNKLDVFDSEAYRKNPMEFIVTATDIEKGSPVYAVCAHGDAADMEWMRASASMPVFAKPVKIGRRLLLDGGCSDSVPLKFMEKRGYDRNVVILTQPDSYRKQPMKMMPVLESKLSRYPLLLQRMRNRHAEYNETIAYVRRRVRAGAAFVIQPEQSLHIGKMERDPEKLQKVYDIGRMTAKKRLDDLRIFLNP